MCGGAEGSKGRGSAATDERFGFIWIYPGASAPGPFWLLLALRDRELIGSDMEPQQRLCHPHAATTNGVDIHHVKAVRVYAESEYTVSRPQDNVIVFDSS